jgi:hypothetical protein
MKAFCYIALYLQTAWSWQYVFEDSHVAECHESCFTTTVSAYQTVKSPIWFSQSPYDSFERSKFSAINDTAFEQWYFEGVSPAGDVLIVSLGRDPSYRPLGFGVLPLEMMIAFANGTRYAKTDFAVESRVQDCCGRVQGTWRTKTSSVSWVVSADLGSAEVEFDMPTVSGKMKLQSFTPPRYADGSTWPHPSGRVQIAPYLNVAEAIPVGNASVDLQVLGSPLRFFGIGGHFHDWASFDWFKILESWRNMRAVVGPFALSLWKPKSRIDQGTEYTSGVLYKDGTPILAVYGPDSDTASSGNRLSIHGNSLGTLSGGLNDSFSGWTVDFFDTEHDKHWRFVSKHQLLAHEVSLGDSSGLSVFADLVEGGEVDADQSSGYGICEQITLPTQIGPSAVLDVIKLHRDNTGSTTLQIILNMVSAAVLDVSLTLSWMILGRG